jgi:hypothetical protein
MTFSHSISKTKCFLNKWYKIKKEKTVDRFLNNPHKAWILLFFICYGLAFVIAFAFDFYFPKIEYSTAQFLLSALIQSQAAIIAIVITITFIIIQLYSSH